MTNTESTAFSRSRTFRILDVEKDRNIYDLRLEQGIESGLSLTDAAIAVTEAYLAGKPGRRSKHKISAADRNAAFWTCEFLEKLSSEVYDSEAFVLALTQYMGQEKTANLKLIRRIARVSPEAVRRAVRYSGLVLRRHSARWAEIEQLATSETTEFSEFIRICHTLDRAHRERVAAVETYSKPLAELTPLELLTYASLYAFEYLLPKAYSQEGRGAGTDNDTQEIIYAIDDIVIWKLRTTTDAAFHLTDATIGKSLRVHLSPFLFPSPDLTGSQERICQTFGRLVVAQAELNTLTLTSTTPPK